MKNLFVLLLTLLATLTASAQNMGTSPFKEVDCKDLRFNPFSLLGDEWMLVTAGNQNDGCNTMTISWGHLGCIWGNNDPSMIIYLRPTRYTKTFVDREQYFTVSVMDSTYREQMEYLGTVSGRNEDKIAKAGFTKVFADSSVYFSEAKMVFICKKVYASPLRSEGFFYPETVDKSYPQRDFHTMYVGKIEKVLVRNDEYLAR